MKFNDILNKLYDYDYMIGIKDGKGCILKWTSACPNKEIGINEFIYHLFKILNLSTNIDIFDDGLKMELTEVIVSTLKKHNIEVK